MGRIRGAGWVRLVGVEVGRRVYLFARADRPLGSFFTGRGGPSGRGFADRGRRGTIGGAGNRPELTRRTPHPWPNYPQPTPRRWPTRLGAVAVGLATLALMVATEPRLAIVWDEGFTLGREARIRAWFRALADPPGVRRDVGAAVAPVGAGPAGRARGRPGRDEVDTRAELFSPA